MRLSITSQTGRYERETIDDRKDRRHDRRAGFASMSFVLAAVSIFKTRW